MKNMETFWSTSHAAGAQSSYLESLYESYLDNPLSIPDDWKIYFDSLPQINGSQEEVSHKEIINKFKAEEVNPSIQTNRIHDKTNSKQVKVIQLIQAYRNRGHQKAKLDPLGLKPIRHCDDLEINFHNLDNSDLSDIFDTDLIFMMKMPCS